MINNKKISLKSQIFFIMLLQILLVLTLVYVAFLVILATDKITTYSFLEMAEYVKSMLFYVLLIACALAFVMSHIFSSSISRPVCQIAKVAEKISKMNFTTNYEQIKNSSAEMEDLTHSLQNMENVISHYYYGRNTLLQNISHEIRTPLMSIHGYAEAIREGIEDDIKESMTVIMNESNRISDMVEQLLKLSKSDAFIGQKRQFSISLKSEISNIIKTLNGAALTKGIELKSKFEATDTICCVSVDVLQIILSNLISNSLRYAQKTVQVALREDSSFAIIDIEDDGSGISQERIKHLFKRGYKGDDGNFGLGLHIVYAAVETISGEITVSSTEKGTCFTVKIPKNSTTHTNFSN